MNVDRMRWVDRWIGVPICAALTLIHRVARLVGRPAPASPHHVLFIELAEMGSLVLAAPALERLRRRHPDVRTFFAVFGGLRDCVTLLGHARPDDVFTIDSSNVWTLTRDTWRVMRAAQRANIDTVINLEMFARYSSILAFLSGARTRVGFHAFTQPGLYTGDLLTHRVAYNPHIHTAQSFLALVEALDHDPANLPMGKFVVDAPVSVAPVTADAASRAAVWTLLRQHGPNVDGKRLILVNPNASPLIAVRRWPLQHYIELVRRLVADPRNVCVLTGVLAERPEARAIADQVGSDRVIDLTGRTSFKQLIDLFNVADLLVTNDSGPAQFAALTDIEVVVFFGPETPKLYGPLTERCTVMYSDYACSPCVSAYNQRRTPCTDNQCLSRIDVDQVYQTIVRQLERRAQRTMPAPAGA